MSEQSNLQYSKSESKEGLYDVYYTPEGKKLLVLKGLDPRDQISSPPLQQFVHEHYAVFFYGYNILFFCIVVYLAGMHIVIPLLKKYGWY